MRSWSGSIPLKKRGKVSDISIRPVLFYGLWALMKKVEEVLMKCDRQMLRYITSTTWKDGMSSAIVTKRCGVKEQSFALRS